MTKSKLFEVSLVDVGANDDAIVLYKDEERITLGKDGECALPLLNNQPIQKTMEQKQMALLLGLPETADEAAIRAAIGVLNAAKAENATLKAANETLALAQVTSLVDKAIAERRITADKKDQFLNLGKKIGAEELQQTFSAMAPQTKLSEVVGHQGGAPTAETATFKKLSEVPADKLEELRENSPEEYKKLYKAEYGMECEI